jgi:YHS domain-containing protein
MAATLNVAFAKINVGSDEVAIHGYDVVAYFLEGRAAQGTTEFEHSWGDANWRFSSEANKNLFVANPEQYAPQYGGFCAVCLALDGELADANPKAWTIVDGKLYLNYSMHQRTQWRIRSAAYVKLGDEAWTEVMTRESRPAKSEALFQIAVMSPLPGPDTRGLNVGSDIYESILQQPSFSIAFADEPYDPSALSFLNRGGDWPYPSTRIEASAAWEVFLGRAKNKPKFERMFDAGRDLGVDAILMWDYSWGFEQRSYPVRVYLIDVDKRHVYEHEGTTMRPEEPVRKAFDDFLAGREGY